MCILHEIKRIQRTDKETNERPTTQELGRKITSTTFVLTHWHWHTLQILYERIITRTKTYGWHYTVAIHLKFYVYCAYIRAESISTNHWSTYSYFWMEHQYLRLVDSIPILKINKSYFKLKISCKSHQLIRKTETDKNSFIILTSQWLFQIFILCKKRFIRQTTIKYLSNIWFGTKKLKFSILKMAIWHRWLERKNFIFLYFCDLMLFQRLFNSFDRF